MKTFLKYLRSGLILTVAMLIICGLAYPALMTGLGQAIFPNQAHGSMITAAGERTEDPEKAVGSAIVGQDFSGDARYFQARISSVNYNTYTEEQLENGEYGGVGSGTFNYGASNEDLKARVQEDVQKFIEAHPGVEEGDIPADLLTASGSGLDPNISPEAADIQIPAIAEASGLSRKELRKIVEENTSGKILGIFGHDRVNVLMCNLAIAERIGEI